MTPINELYNVSSGVIEQRVKELKLDEKKNPFDKVLADADRDYWMTAQEALEYGMIDNILCKR